MPVYELYTLATDKNGSCPYPPFFFPLGIVLSSGGKQLQHVTYANNNGISYLHHADLSTLSISSHPSALVLLKLKAKAK